MDHRAGEVRAPVRGSARANQPGGSRNAEAFARVGRIRILTSSLAGGVLGGSAAFAMVLFGSASPSSMVAMTLGGMVIGGAGPWVISELGGRAAAMIYNPTGGASPRPRELSHAESLAVRGLYDEAVAAFSLAIAEDPTDPTPHVKIARIERDRRGRHEEAARWFRQALDLTGPGSGPALLTLKELMELYTVKLGAPQRAAPLLARIAEQRPTTPEGKWAREELAAVKQKMSPS